MTAWGWGATSAERLAGVNEVLPDVLNLARDLGCPELTIPPYGGARTLMEQADLMGGGTSWTLNSKHRVDERRHTVGRDKSAAVDVAPWPIDWEDVARFQVVAAFILGAAMRLGVNLEWGGLWRQKDYGHFELRDER